MGNGTSQSVVLGHSRTPAGVPFYQHRYQQRAPNYAHPHNRVLPKPVAGQRLRSTDNGHILHSAGTIRGLKPGSPTPPETEIDPEVVDALKKRSELLNKEQDGYNRYNLQNYRMFHSDPDISGRSRVDTGYPLGMAESAVSRRAGGGAANKATKLKHRKKARAPDPPANESFPRQYERRAQSSSDLRYIPENNDYRCMNGSTQEWAKTKCRAPAPPSTRVNPPPPPPPPLPAQISTTCRPLQDSQNLGIKNNSEQHSTYRLLNSSGTSFEKKHLSDDNWRLSRSVGDLRISDDQNFNSDSPRPTVFDSKNILNSNFIKKKPPLIPHPPDPFQKEIQAVTQKIAHSQQKEHNDTNGQTDSPQKSTKPANPPKPYYFSDTDVFKISSKPQPKYVQEPSRDTSLVPATKCSSPITSYDNNENVMHPIKMDKNTLENGAPLLQRFSPTRRRLKSPFKSPSPSSDGTSNKDFHYIESFPHDGESDIDIKLRPVLPRKTLDIPSFSPVEAWHALGSDDQNNSNRSTSDESMHHHYNEKNKRFLQNNTGLKSIHCYRSNKEAPFGESHWTPRQDLEDSDTSSLNSEEVVVPKNQLGEFSTRFSLPTVMFSNMRPIGADLPLNSKVTERNNPNCFSEDTRRFRMQKEKSVKNLTSNADLNAVSHFKKFLGMRNKYLSEEDVSVSDSNWTFGGSSALQQKKGKHYSSDLMLSDKKKYELIVKNDFGDFLGDILVSKANDMRNKIQKSSDSGNSNFSFYSTEGHVMYLPDSDSHMSGNDSSPIRNRGRHHNSRKVNKTDQAQSTPKKYNKKLTSSDSERRRGLELVRMLEDDARRRRNKEKISIRQQLQMMKRIDSDVDDDDEEDEVDEAYFTEPKSLEEMSPRHMSPSQSHFHYPGISNHNRYSNPINQASPSLTHWTSTPALFYDAGTKSPLKGKGYHSNTSLNSSPDFPIWPERQFGNGFPVKKQFMQNRRLFEKQRSLPEEDCLVDGRSSSEDFKLSTVKDSKKTSGQTSQIKDKKTHNIYKQLMDIVRKEERQMQKAQGNDCLSASRESSYSQRESSHSSTSSHDSVSSSSNSYTDSSDHGKHQREEYRGKSGVPANNEFHTSSGVGMDRTIGIQTHGGITVQESKHVTPAFHAAFAKPFTPNKGYRPVPFEVPVQTATSNCRLLTVQEGHKVQAKVS